MGHERRLTLGLIASMARALLDRRAMMKADSLRLDISPTIPSNSCYSPSTTSNSCYSPSTTSNSCYSPSTTSTATLFDQSGVDLVIDQVYYGPFCCPPVFYPSPTDHQYYAVYTYEYGSAPSPPPPCCDVTVTSSSSCCPYCETCPQCVAANSEL